MSLNIPITNIPVKLLLQMQVPVILLAPVNIWNLHYFCSC